MLLQVYYICDEFQSIFLNVIVYSIAPHAYLQISCKGKTKSLNVYAHCCTLTASIWSSKKNSETFLERKNFAILRWLLLADFGHHDFVFVAQSWRMCISWHTSWMHSIQFDICICKYCFEYCLTCSHGPKCVQLNLVWLRGGGLKMVAIFFKFLFQ